MRLARIPIACTLTSTDANDRVAEWRGFLRDCVTTVTRAENELQLILKLGDATLLRAVDLAAREQACCAFFSFGIEIEADSRTLVIGVAADATEVLDDMSRLLPAELLPQGS